MKRSSMHKKILWLCQTALMLALLVSVQGFTSGLGNQYITGSCVNLILAVTVLMVGLWGGAIVAMISPFFAFLFGIGPKFVQLLPVIALGNLALVIVLYLLASKKDCSIVRKAVGWICAAVAKFAVLYVGMVQLLVPALVDGGIIPKPASAVLTVQFSWPQLITALIGSAIALAIVPALRKAIKN